MVRLLPKSAREGLETTTNRRPDALQPATYVLLHHAHLVFVRNFSYSPPDSSDHPVSSPGFFRHCGGSGGRSGGYSSHAALSCLLYCPAGGTGCSSSGRVDGRVFQKVPLSAQLVSGVGLSDGFAIGFVWGSELTVRPGTRSEDQIPRSPHIFKRGFLFSCIRV
ncbi:hypothetical protein MRX96_023934 [Rhipicephalus microplus]